MRGDIYAVIVAAEEYGVEVAFEDLIFRVFRLQLHGQISFLQLAFVALLCGKEGLLNQLLRNGGAALRCAAGEVADQRACDAFDVDAVVLVETRVFHCDKSIPQHFRDLID